MEELSAAEERAYYSLTRKAFDLLAPVYNIMTLPLTRVRHQVVDFTQPGQGALVLDVATGTGQQAFAFAERGCRAVGIDLTDSMLLVARQHNRQGKVQFEAGDATHLRYGSDTFDMTCVSFALHDMPPAIRERVLREMVRVTKRDGTIVIVDYGLPQNELYRALVHAVISLYERGYYKQFMTVDLRKMLELAGVQITEEHHALHGIVRILKGQKQSRRIAAS